MDKDALYTKAMADDTDAINELVKMSDRIGSGFTILHIEASLGNKERVSFIARKFKKKNWLVKANQLGQTPLHLAIEGEHTEVVDELISAARKLPSSSTDDSYSVFRNFVRQANSWNNTPLHLAVGKGNLAIVELTSC